MESTGLTVAEGVVKTLEILGVNLTFGIPGSQTCPFYDALYSSKIRHILVRHEQSAAYMADAYAKFTGRIGVCDGTGGPGATNLLTGVATSWTDRVPVLVFTGQQPLAELGRGAFQELDHQAIFNPIVKKSFTLLGGRYGAVKVVREAYKEALEGRPGPVHIDMPLDVQIQTLEPWDVKLLGNPPPKIWKPVGGAELVREAVKRLAGSSRPLIIAGGGVHYTCGGGWRQLRALAEYLMIPVATTFNGRGCFPEDHPLSAGRMGIHAPAYNDKMLGLADVILAVGCRFAALSTRRWSNVNPEAKIIHVDVDPTVIGLNYKVEIGIVGDAAGTLEAMVEEAKNLEDPGLDRRREWIKLLEEAKEDWRSSVASKMSSEDKPLKPQRVCYEIRRSFSRDTVFTLDAGNNKLWASTFLEIYEPRTWIQSGCFGPMGYALPAALACKLVDPDRTVVAICGDGGFYMSLHELSTAVQEGIPVVVCVFNDGFLGTIRHRQEDLYGGRLISVELSNPSFASVAESFRCVGLEAETPGQLRSALKEALKSSREGYPTVIDVKIDGEERLPP